jgi:uncharacterized protein YbbC (DUF1343 family)
MSFYLSQKYSFQLLLADVSQPGKPSGAKRALFRPFAGLLFLLGMPLLFACANKVSRSAPTAESSASVFQESADSVVVVGANRTEAYFPMLTGKKIGLVANQTSVIFRETGPYEDVPAYTHLVDSLLSSGLDLVRVFAPEHGFRGTADAGEEVSDGIDKRSGLPVISLYGQNRKPTKEQLQGLEVVLFDIQDVGVRFYTYIATLQLVMEACAEAGIPVVVLDRPNPNGQYVDGPTMEPHLTGFLGMTLIPLVYGMTIGEYATMINEEGWLEGGLKADLSVIPLENYAHDQDYSLPVNPSPNLPNDKAVNLYPSLGLFEGTQINAGRGTDQQFQRYGAPFLNNEYFTFQYTPESNPGAKSPKHQGEICYGEDLSATPQLREVSLKWLIRAYRNCEEKERFFNTSGFGKHAGTETLQKQIEAGLSEEEIKKTWQSDLSSFLEIRKKYLLYP